MSVLYRSQISDLLVPGLLDVIALQYNQYPDEYSKSFNVKTSKRKYETSTTIEGLPVAVEKNEGTSVNYDTITQGYDSTFTHLTFAIGSRITREAYEDDLYSITRTKIGTFMARSMKQRWELLAATVLNNGFSVASSSGTATGMTGGDGQFLFDSDHPWASGGTYSNLLTTAADLSPTSLEAMLLQIETATEANSINIALIPKQILVAPANRFNVETILKSELKSGTANNDLNVLKSVGLTPQVNHYLTDADAWFVMCQDHTLSFFERERPKLENEDDFDTKDAKFSLIGRASAGYETPMGLFGTPGA